MSSDHRLTPEVQRDVSSARRSGTCSGSVGGGRFGRPSQTLNVLGRFRVAKAVFLLGFETVRVLFRKHFAPFTKASEPFFPSDPCLLHSASFQKMLRGRFTSARFFGIQPVQTGGSRCFRYVCISRSSDRSCAPGADWGLRSVQAGGRF